MTPADELKQAAARLRETAARATRGPWEDVSDGDEGAWPRMIVGAPNADGYVEEVLKVHEEIGDWGVVAREDVAWMALASPVLAEPLAAWLEDTIGAYVDFAQSHGPEVAERVVWRALAVARALNGGAS